MPGSPTRCAGRPPVTSRSEIEHIALDLFARHRFDAITVDDIAAAAGIGRRTVFRHYASENDIPRGAFDDRLDRMRATFARLPADLPVMTGVRLAVLDLNHVDAAEQHRHRSRLRLILDTPALQAHSTLRYGAWRQVVADYAAARLGLPADGLVPQTMGHVSLGAASAAYERRLRGGQGELVDLLDTVFRVLERGLVAG